MSGFTGIRRGGEKFANVLAALCSFIIPGLGQLLQGRALRGLVYFVLSGIFWLVLLGWIVHIVSTLDAAKKMIDTRNSQYNFLSRYSKNELMEINLALPYSSIYIVEFEDIIKKIIQTKIFNMGKMYVPMISQGKLSARDINLIVDILKDIPLFMGRQRLLEGGIIENMKYIKIKGLL